MWQTILDLRPSCEIGLARMASRGALWPTRVQNSHVGAQLQRMRALGEDGSQHGPLSRVQGLRCNRTRADLTNGNMPMFLNSVPTHCLIFYLCFFQAPFINKGPKWYSKLAQRCRHGKTRSTNWLKMRQSVRTLVNLGETPEAIFEWIRGLNCMKRCMKRSREKASEKCPEKEATVCAGAESPKTVCDGLESPKAMPESPKTVCDGPVCDNSPESPKPLKGVTTNTLDFQTPRLRKPKSETIVKKHGPPNKRARKEIQEEDIKAKEDINANYAENAEARAMPDLHNNAGCAEEYLGTFDDLLCYHHTGSNEMFRC